MNTKRIVISCTNAESLINFRGQLIKELLRNYEVYVITPLITDNGCRFALRQLGIKVYEIKINRNNISILLDLQYILRLIFIIKEVKPDIFFAYTFKPVIFGAIAATLCRVKNINVMLTGLGYSFTNPKDTFLTKMSKLMLRISLRLNKELKIIFQNRDDYLELLEKKIISRRSKTFIVNGSGVDLSHYDFSIPNTSSLQFVMFSRLIKSKGIIEFYQAAKIIKDKYPQVKFILAGGYKAGSTDSIEEELFVKLNEEGVIEYLGWVNDVRPYIKDSTAIVLPSYYREGVPRSLLEGLAMGRPIITTDMVGCKETICVDSGSENGYLIPARNTMALVSKMELLINNPNNIIEMGRNGRLFAEKTFDVTKVNRHMLNILET